MHAKQIFIRIAPDELLEMDFDQNNKAIQQLSDGWCAVECQRAQFVVY